MVKRTILKQLKDHIASREISLIVGPRQAGKTTLMMMLKDELEKKGAHTIYFNLDIEVDNAHFLSQERFIQKIVLEIGKSGGYIFIDEIQRKENAGIFLKGLYDMNLPYKFIVSGSGSIELKEKIHESLAGRKQVFVLDPLSFIEFLDYKTGYRYENAFFDYIKVEPGKVRGLLDEYLTFGGYPRVVLDDTIEKKRRTMAEVYQSYLERDIRHLLNVKKTQAFSDLIRVMASQVGRLANRSELSATLGVSLGTVKEYLWYLEKTFIVRRIAPFFRNIRKEITKAPVYYFKDAGMRNFALGRFGSTFAPEEKGFLFQNFVGMMLDARFRDTAADIKHWRTKDKAEVDFIIDYGDRIVPVEVKYREYKNPELTRSFRSFIGKYIPRKAFVVNLTLDLAVTEDKTEIRFIPYYKVALPTGTDVPSDFF